MATDLTDPYLRVQLNMLFKNGKVDFNEYNLVRVSETSDSPKAWILMSLDDKKQTEDEPTKIIIAKNTTENDTNANNETKTTANDATEQDMSENNDLVVDENRGVDSNSASYAERCKQRLKYIRILNDLYKKSPRGRHEYRKSLKRYLARWNGIIDLDHDYAKPAPDDEDDNVSNEARNVMGNETENREIGEVIDSDEEDPTPSATHCTKEQSLSTGHGQKALGSPNGSDDSGFESSQQPQNSPKEEVYVPATPNLRKLAEIAKQRKEIEEKFVVQQGPSETPRPMRKRKRSEDDEDKTKEFKAQCPMCGKRFEDQSSLPRHLKDQHYMVRKDSEGKAKRERKTFACNVCQRNGKLKPITQW